MNLVNSLANRLPIHAPDLVEKWDRNAFGDQHLIKIWSEVSRTGLLFVKVNIWTQKATSAPRAQVYIQFRDQRGNILWASNPRSVMACAKGDLFELEVKFSLAMACLLESTTTNTPQNGR